MYIIRCVRLDMRCSSTGLRKTNKGDRSDEVWKQPCMHACCGCFAVRRLLISFCMHTPRTNNFLRWRPDRRHRSFISIGSAGLVAREFSTSPSRIRHTCHLRTQPLQQLAHCKCKTSRSVIICGAAYIFEWSFKRQELWRILKLLVCSSFWCEATMIPRICLRWTCLI